MSRSIPRGGAARAAALAIALTLGFAASSAPAFAGKEVGNGGDGVLLNGKIHVLDLLEAGCEEAPYFIPGSQADPVFLAAVEAVFTDFPVPTAVIARKLSEVARFDRVLANSLLLVIQMHSWKLVNPSLVDIPDENTHLEIPRGQLVQLAIRSNQTIRINREHWSKLDAANQAALVLHEAIYAMLPADSPRAREINGYLFTPEFHARGRASLVRLAMSLPHASGANPERLFVGDDRVAWEPRFDAGCLQCRQIGRGVSLASLAGNPSLLDEELRSACASPFETRLVIRATVVRLYFNSYENPEGQRVTFADWRVDGLEDWSRSWTAEALTPAAACFDLLKGGLGGATEFYRERYDSRPAPTTP